MSTFDVPGIEVTDTVGVPQGAAALYVNSGDWLDNKAPELNVTLAFMTSEPAWLAEIFTAGPEIVTVLVVDAEPENPA